MTYISDDYLKFIQMTFHSKVQDDRKDTKPEDNFKLTKQIKNATNLKNTRKNAPKLS